MTHIREAVFPVLNLPRKGKRAAVPMELDRNMELEYDSIFEYSTESNRKSTLKILKVD